MNQPTENVRKINLTKGKVALVDADDFAELTRWKWSASKSHNEKYVAVRGGVDATGTVTTLTMHRQIMGLVRGDGMEVDHINHDTLDNRRSNLRVVTPTQNKRWQPSRAGSSSEYVGVSWDSARYKWRAQIQVDGKVLNLGRFSTEYEAALARDFYVVMNKTGHEMNVVGSGS